MSMHVAFKAATDFSCKRREIKEIVLTDVFDLFVVLALREGG